MNVRLGEFGDQFRRLFGGVYSVLVVKTVVIFRIFFLGFYFSIHYLFVYTSVFDVIVCNDLVLLTVRREVIFVLSDTDGSGFLL